MGQKEHVELTVQYDPAGHDRGPEAMPMDAAVSVEVCTVIPSATLVPLFPMVNPLNVIANTDDGLMKTPEIVMTTSYVDVTLHTAVRPETLLAPAATRGVTDEAKKLEG